MILELGQAAIVDDQVRNDHRDKIFEMAGQLEYGLGWSDNNWNGEVFLHKLIDDTPISYLLNDYYKDIFSSEWPEFSNYELKQTLVNCGVPGAVNLHHRDQYKEEYKNLITILYMVNPRWDPSWGGELKLWDDKKEEVTKVVPYVPGRIVAFDGETSHCAGTFSYKAPYWRFTIASWYVLF
jgi:Rps23 Pro-64 3,4-dihydroxylase Tpa1-like proline 4-hydroxylase